MKHFMCSKAESRFEWHEVSAGSAGFMPRGLVHTFKNVGDQPSRMLITTTPSKFEKFFARCAEEFAKPAVPTWRGSSRLVSSTAFISCCSNLVQFSPNDFGELMVHLWSQAVSAAPI